MASNQDCFSWSIGETEGWGRLTLPVSVSPRSEEGRLGETFHSTRWSGKPNYPLLLKG